MVPNSDKSDGKPRVKCKMCGATYLAVSKYGTENLKVHIERCPRRNSQDIGQLMFCQNSGSMLEQCESEDDYMRKISYQMLAKFEKYWSEFNVMLAIAVILDPRYKLQFVEFSYKKLYGNSSQEYLHVRAKLASFFMEYSSGTPTSSASERNVCRVVREAEFSSFSRMTSQIMEEFDSFQTDDLAANMQKSQLELYLDEPRANRNANLDILDFWKRNEFSYPDLANMARDILSVPISTVASESFFSVDGRIIDQFKSALKPDIVEALVCTRDWLYGDQESEEMKLDELIEDILEVDINKRTVDNQKDQEE